MKKIALLVGAVIFAWSCNSNHAPDVSNIKMDIKIGRFDKAFFEMADTNNMQQQVAVLQRQFPYFTNDFFTYIVGLPTSGPADSSHVVYNEIKRFYQLIKPLYDSVEPHFKNIDGPEKELKQAFRYVKYYVPSYKVPEVVTYIGPFDAPGVAITPNAMAIGLQLFAGKNFSFYQTAEGQEAFPMYISRRFEPQYIVPACMKAVVEDVYPDRSAGSSMIAQIVEKGKRWYLLDKFLPGTPDSLKTDYTQKQLSWCRENEGLIWNFILQGTDIYNTEPAIIKTYIGESPTTNGMPEASPGNIGQWIGWQIVKKYVDRNPEISVDALMKMDAKKLFTEAKYKPK